MPSHAGCIVLSSGDGRHGSHMLQEQKNTRVLQLVNKISSSEKPSSDVDDGRYRFQSSNTAESRLWLSSQDMYRLNLQAGTIVLTSRAEDGKPVSLLSLHMKVVSDDSSPSLLGAFVCAAAVWPHSSLKPGRACVSDGLHDALGRPDKTSTELLVYTSDFKGSPPLADSLYCRLLLHKHDDLPVLLAREMALPVSNNIARTASPATRKSPILSPGMRGTTMELPITTTSTKKKSPPTPDRSKTAEPTTWADSKGIQRGAILHLLQQRGDRVINCISNLCLRHLQNRIVLPGNILYLPILGEHALFIVEGSKTTGLKKIGPRTEVKLLFGPDDVGPDVPGLQCSNRMNNYIQVAVSAASVVDEAGLEGPATQAARRAAEIGKASLGTVSFADLGGCEDKIRALEELVMLPLQSPELFVAYGVQRPRGVLLHGPPGTGKTLLAGAAATECKAAFFVLNGPDIISEFYGESEVGLRGVFAAARACAPSIVFIDEIDAIAPARGVTSEAATRLVTTLLKEMDSVPDIPVVVLAATNRIDSIDPALRRPGRLDREIEMGVPSPGERLQILRQKLAKLHHKLNESDVRALAVAAHGFVGADIAALCTEAALIALRRNICDLSREDMFVRNEDFKQAETYVRPSAMREIALEVPKVCWDDVGGLADIKDRLREAVEWPIQNESSLERVGAQVPRGILLFGPPGCSKTLLARAVASQAGMNFLAVKGPELYSKYVGESEKAVSVLFKKARMSAPAIIFLDEIDGLVIRREELSGPGVSERVLSQLLQEMDGLQSRKGVVVIAATNRPDQLDSALLRPGRFDRLLYVPPPTEDERVAIFRVHTRRMPLCADVDLRVLAERTSGYCGADITAVCREAALTALEESLDIETVAFRHFIQSLERVPPSASKKTALDIYETYIRHGK